MTAPAILTVARRPFTPAEEAFARAAIAAESLSGKCGNAPQPELPEPSWREAHAIWEQSAAKKVQHARFVVPITPTDTPDEATSGTPAQLSAVKPADTITPLGDDEYIIDGEIYLTSRRAAAICGRTAAYFKRVAVHHALPSRKTPRQLRHIHNTRLYRKTDVMKLPRAIAATATGTPGEFNANGRTYVTIQRAAILRNAATITATIYASHENWRRITAHQATGLDARRRLYLKDDVLAKTQPPENTMPGEYPGEYIIDGETYVTAPRAAALRGISVSSALIYATPEDWQRIPAPRGLILHNKAKLYLKADVLAGRKPQRKRAM